jgi:hypothetical protein
MARYGGERLEKDLGLIDVLLGVDSDGGDKGSKRKKRSFEEELVERAIGRPTHKDFSEKAWDAALRKVYQPYVLDDISEWDFYAPVYRLLRRRLKTKDAADFYIDDVLAFIQGNADHFVHREMAPGRHTRDPFGIIQGLKRDDVNYAAFHKGDLKFTGRILGPVPGKPMVYTVETGSDGSLGKAQYEMDTSKSRLRLRRGPYHMEIDSSKGTSEGRDIFIFIHDAEKAETTARILPEQLDKILPDAVKDWLDLEYKKDQKSSEVYLKKLLQDIEILRREVEEVPAGEKLEKLKKKLEDKEDEYQRHWLEIGKVMNVKEELSDDVPSGGDLYELGKKFKGIPHKWDVDDWYEGMDDAAIGKAEITEGISKGIKTDLTKSLKEYADQEESFKGPLTYKILVPIFLRSLEDGDVGWRDRFVQNVRKYIKENKLFESEALKGKQEVIRDGLKALRSRVLSDLEVKTRDDVVSGSKVEGFGKVVDDNGLEKVLANLKLIPFNIKPDVYDLTEELQDVVLHDPRFRHLKENLRKRRMREFSRGTVKVGASGEENLKGIHDDLKKLWSVSNVDKRRLRSMYYAAMQMLKGREVTPAQYKALIEVPTQEWFVDFLMKTEGIRKAPEILDGIAYGLGSRDDSLLRTLWKAYLEEAWDTDNMMDKMDGYKRFTEYAPSMIVDKLSDLKDKVRKEIQDHLEEESVPTRKDMKKRRRAPKLDVHAPEKSEVETIIKEKDKARYEKLRNLFA